ncbi:MAG: LacI family DNA-binding transcriptional regulator [Pseudomonadota bacterium]
MRDVARAAGVSRMTVSRALRPDSSIADDTRERILSVVRQMNYVPDQVAGSLTTGRSGFVAVLVPSLNNLHFAQTVQTLTEALEAIGRQVLLGHTGYSEAREEQLVEAMLRRRPEAIVLSYDGHSDRTVELLSDASIPVVELWERPDEPIAHTIGFSNHAAVARMIAALIGRGYKAIAFLGEADDGWTRGAARLGGWRTAMDAAGLSAHRLMRIGKPPLSIEDGAAALPALLNAFPDTDCVMCVSDPPAFGVLSTLKAMGRRVPEEIGVVGFGNFEVSRFADPTLTTVVVDPERIGGAAGQLLTEIFEGGGPLRRRKDVPIEVELAFRGSTR